MFKRPGTVQCFSRIVKILLIFAAIFVSGCEDAQSRQKKYRGAEYRTKSNFLYGKFEVRMKSAGGSGFLSSFFTYHDPPDWTVSKWNEIDIEILGRYNNETQFNTITPGEVSHVYRNENPFNPHIAFHTYAFEWTPDYVAWFIDGYEMHRQTGEHIALLNKPSLLMANIWPPAFIDWTGIINPDSLPVYAFYDWIRYSAYTPETADRFTEQWTDSLDNWDTDRWETKRNWTWPGNDSNFIPDNIVFRDGYMILALTKPDATGYRGGIIVDIDVDPPSVIWAHAFGTRIQVFFSEPVEQTSAETVANYIIPGAAIKSAALQEDPRVVELQIESSNPRGSASIIVRGVKDVSPSQFAMPLQTATLSHAHDLPASFNIGGAASDGFLEQQTWDFYQEHGTTGGSAGNLPASVTVAGASPPAVYETYVDNPTFFQTRVPAGKYEVKLLMVEPVHESAGARVFDIIAEGRVELEDLDIFARAGKHAALEVTLRDIEVTDGVLDLYFRSEAGTAIVSGIVITQTVATSVGDATGGIPAEFGLQAYPNPFNPSTKVQFELSRAANVEISVFDIRGRLVDTLMDAPRQAGAFTQTFNAGTLDSGVYLIRLNVDGRTEASRKVLFLK